MYYYCNGKTSSVFYYCIDFYYTDIQIYNLQNYEKKKKRTNNYWLQNFSNLILIFIFVRVKCLNLTDFMRIKYDIFTGIFRLFFALFFLNATITTSAIDTLQEKILKKSQVLINTEDSTSQKICAAIDSINHTEFLSDSSFVTFIIKIML